MGGVDLHRTTVLAGELDKADIPAKAVHVVGGAGDGEWGSVWRGVEGMWEGLWKNRRLFFLVNEAGVSAWVDKAGGVVAAQAVLDVLVAGAVKAYELAMDAYELATHAYKLAMQRVEQQQAFVQALSASVITQMRVVDKWRDKCMDAQQGVADAEAAVAVKAELKEAEDKLEKAEEKLEKTKAELEKAEDKLEKVKAKLKEAEDKLKEAKAELEAKAERAAADEAGGADKAAGGNGVRVFPRVQMTTGVRANDDVVPMAGGLRVRWVHDPVCVLPLILMGEVSVSVEDPEWAKSGVGLAHAKLGPLVSEMGASLYSATHVLYFETELASAAPGLHSPLMQVAMKELSLTGMLARYCTMELVGRVGTVWLRDALDQQGVGGGVGMHMPARVARGSGEGVSGSGSGGSGSGSSRHMVSPDKLTKKAVRNSRAYTARGVAAKACDGAASTDDGMYGVILAGHQDVLASEGVHDAVSDVLLVRPKAEGGVGESLLGVIEIGFRAGDGGDKSYVGDHKLLQTFGYLGNCARSQSGFPAYPIFGLRGHYPRTNKAEPKADDVLGVGLAMDALVLNPAVCADQPDTSSVPNSLPVVQAVAQLPLATEMHPPSGMSGTGQYQWYCEKIAGFVLGVQGVSWCLDERKHRDVAPARFNNVVTGAGAYVYKDVASSATRKSGAAYLRKYTDLLAAVLSVPVTGGAATAAVFNAAAGIQGGVATKYENVLGAEDAALVEAAVTTALSAAAAANAKEAVAEHVVAAQAARAAAGEPLTRLAKYHADGARQAVAAAASAGESGKTSRDFGVVLKRVTEGAPSVRGVIDVLEVLQRMAKDGIVHKDIHRGNVLFGEVAGSTRRGHLIDWDWAGLVDTPYPRGFNVTIAGGRRHPNVVDAVCSGGRTIWDEMVEAKVEHDHFAMAYVMEQLEFELPGGVWAEAVAAVTDSRVGAAVQLLEPHADVTHSGKHEVETTKTGSPPSP